MKNYWDMDDGASDRTGSTPASPQAGSLLQVLTSEGGGVGSPTKSHVLEPSDQQAGEHALLQGEGRVLVAVSGILLSL